MSPYLSVKFCELTKLFKHIPPEPRMQLEQQLRHVFNQIEQAMNWVAPVAQPPQPTQEAS